MTGRYRSAIALRRALETRLEQEAADRAADLARLRRLVVFDRVAARLSVDPVVDWILKGGAALEFRLHSKARATKDMDLAASTDGGDLPLDGGMVRDLLIDALALDEDGDGFFFQVSPPAALAADTAGRGGWRFSIESRLAGREFATVRIDVVARGDEITRTERPRLPNMLAFAGTPNRDIEAVDRRQHFAEKIHAFTRDYGNRPNTRVKDLVDLVLLIESGLVADAAVADAVWHVFAVRRTHPVPEKLPDPPPAWYGTYPDIALGLTDLAPRLDAALGLVRGFRAGMYGNGATRPNRKSEMAPKKTPMATTSRARLASVIKSARDTMRKDAGLNGDLDRLPQLSWLLFLKTFDQRVEQPGPMLNASYRPAIEKPYRWQDWATDRDFSSGELKAFVDGDLIPYLADLKKTAGDADDPRNVLSTIFQDVTNRMQSGTLLRDLVNLVDQIHFDSSDDIHTMAFVYESILEEMRDAAGDSGEFYTPRPVNRFMVQQSFLEPGESILDPACGTGGFLVQAYEELVRSVETDTQRRQLQANLRGIEKKPLPYLLASMNMLLHGVEAPRLVRDNALLRMRDATAADRVDVVLTNPPFGGEEERSVVQKFPRGYQTQETSWLFLHAILGQLKQEGRCAIVLPNSSLFANGENSIGARIKKKLMKECDLHTIVRLPQGVFAPYTQIPSNLLFFSKGQPTEEIWFYEIPLPDGRRGYTKTKPMRMEEFAACVQWWGGESRLDREEGGHAWKVPAADIERTGYNLDVANPRAEVGLAHRPSRELVMELIKTESRMLRLLTELDRQLRAEP